MAGTNQHHIPRFLQRGFAIVGDKHKIWRFDKSVIPNKPRSISRTASEDDFYGEELDAVITAQEKRISTTLAKLRTDPTGSIIDPNIAAELIDHLAPRAAHLRQTMERGLRQLISGASELFSKQESVEAIMGLNQSAPTALFEEQASALYDEYPALAQLDIPQSVFIRIAFQLAREQFETTAPDLLSMFNRLLLGWLDKSTEVSRAGHNKALGKTDVLTARRRFLADLSWRIVDAPEEGAILPDCVAIAALEDGSTAPLTLVGAAEIEAVMMPLATDRILYGTGEKGDVAPSLEFNPAAARASHLYFLAGTNDETMIELQKLIDERSSALVDEVVAHAFKDIVPAPVFVDPAVEQTSEVEEAPTGPLRYELSFLGCANEEQAKAISEATQSIVNALGLQLPLNKLDGITFAADYPEALSSIDRGIPGAGPPTTVDPDLATGIAQTVNVVRDGAIKCRIVVNGEIGHALVCDDDQQADWALGVLIRQLDLIAITEFIDTAIPGVLLRPIAEPLQSMLYSMIGSTAEGYIAGHLSAGFVNIDQTIDDYRHVLARSLERALSTIPAERLAYRYHGDLDRLLDISMPLIRDVLSFAADLLGYCAAIDTEPVVRASDLDVALQHAGLAAWFKRFQCDLEAIRLRLGRWQSFDEFTALAVHAERLMWQFGMIPWTNEKGIRIEIPLATDAAELQKV